MTIVVDSVAALPPGPLAAWAPPMSAPSGVLVCAPDAFDIVDVKNVHMAAHREQGVDRDGARLQWDALCAAFESAGLRVEAIAPGPGLEDMVFTANQTLTGLDAVGRKVALLSRMRHESRRREVPLFAEWFASRGWDVVDTLPDDGLFEGAGDVVWHPGRRIAWAGHGFRSAAPAHQIVADAFGTTVVSLRLVDPRFYHLDTCLCPLDEHSALVVREAFDDAGLALLDAVWEEVVPCDAGEAVTALAANAVVAPASAAVVIDQRAERTMRMLDARGLRIVPVDTGEFLKSGGSVFCLKQWLWD